MNSYIVTWVIDIDASSPEGAAKEALKIHRDVFSTSTVFTVTDKDGVQTEVDLEVDKS